VQAKAIKQLAKADKAEIKSLQRELRDKERTLTETAALLVLRKSSMRSGGRSEES